MSIDEILGFPNPLVDSGRRRTPKAPTVHLGNDRCMICGKSRSQVGPLHRAHVLARSKGGKVTVLLCNKHHYEYDHNLLSKSQLAKIGVTPSRYGRYRPNSGGRKKAPAKRSDPFSLDWKMPSL